jgi:E3 ubiquitin-protein ligase MYCBP2
MQKTYLIASDPSISECPKCNETFICEQGDMNAVNVKEKGLDGKALSEQAIKHKAQFRYRCSNLACKTKFCSSCHVYPYHLGYTCEQWKDYQNAQKCRFCEKEINASNTAPKEYGLGPGLLNVCNTTECLEKRQWSCDKIFACGHECIGLRGHPCLDCMNQECVAKDANTDDDFCNICWVDPLRVCPTLKLSCGHFFHFMCLWQKIDGKWPSARITFGFLNCPLCKAQIKHPALADITKTYYDLLDTIQKDAIERVKIEGLSNDRRLKDPNSKYFNNLPAFALDRLAFYPCSKCKKPYFGGMKACEEAGLEQNENYKSEHLVCGSCSSGPNAKACKRHGKKYITYKCKFCCTISSWYCWGSTHFCDKCHKRQEKGDYLNRKPISDLPKCPGLAKCPLGIEHPPNGTADYSLGCVVCLRR